MSLVVSEGAVSGERDTDYSDLRVKHLEMIQGVITRLAGNSSAIKRYCMVVAAAGAGLYKTVDHIAVLVAAVLLTLVFAFMDAKYLQAEKWYRDFYAQVSKEPPNMRPDFRLSVNEKIRKQTSVCDGFKSWATWPLYIALILILSVVWKVD